MEFIKKYWEKIIKIIWWLVLSIIGTIYLWNNYTTISSKQSIIDIIILLAVTILIFMPLVTEANVFGFGIKKELLQTKSELQNEILKIKLDLIQQNNNNAHSDVYINCLPSRDNIEADLKREKLPKHNEEVKIKNNITKQQIILFDIKYAIEKKLLSFTSSLSIKTGSSNYTIAAMLYKYEIIDSRTFEYIRKVNSICNRGIHGEIIDDEYVDYASQMLPRIIDKLTIASNIIKEYSYCICPRCGYRGISKYSNQCPNCGCISDED